MLEHGPSAGQAASRWCRRPRLVACQQAVREVHVDEKVRRYLMQIVHETREHDDLSLGASPRASLALFRTGQAMAAILGRNFVLPDDVKRVARPVLTHRLIVRPESRLRKVTGAAIVEEILSEIPVPTMAGRSRACHEMVSGRIAAAGRGPGVRPGAAGLCHVRAVGRDAGEPVSGPHLDRDI